MRILVTGFTTFAQHSANPSQLVVDALAQRHADVCPVVLPVSYEAAGKQIVALIEAHQPDAVLMLGLAASRSAIHLERFALNLDDGPAPDNDGDLRSGQCIAPDGPQAYLSTLPLEVMRAALAERDLPAAISNHAGAYVCNHVFYAARHTLAAVDSHLPCGFIHLPPVAETGDQAGLPLAVMIAGVECCLDVLRSEAGQFEG